MSFRGYTEHTGLFYLIILLLVTALYFVFFPVTPQGVGLLLLGWGFAAALRLLWLYEVIWFFRRQTNTQRREELPQEILRSMQGVYYKDNGFMALRAINSLSYILILMVVVYMLWGAYLCFTLPDFPVFTDLQHNISAFFEKRGNGYPGFFTIALQDVFMNWAQIMIVGAAFWQSMSFSYIREQRTVIVWVGFVLFCLSLLFNAGILTPVFSFPLGLDDLKTGYGWGRLTVMQNIGVLPEAPFSSFAMRIAGLGWIGALLLYGAGLWTALVLLRGLFRRTGQKEFVFVGILTLIAMVLCDVFIEYSLSKMALWVCGWAVVASCWVGAGSKGYREHKMRWGI